MGLDKVEKWTDAIFYSVIGLLIILTFTVLKQAIADSRSEEKVQYEVYKNCLPRTELETTHIIITKDGDYVCSTTHTKKGVARVVKQRLEFKKT